MKALFLAVAALVGAPVPAIADAGPTHAGGEQSEAERNRAIVTDFFHMFYMEKKTREAFEKHVVADYIQHSPMAPNGREATLQVLEPFLASQPDLTYEIKRILVDGDLAAVHSHVIPAPGERGIAVIDIVRLKDGKIVEHWDVLQPVPEQSANPHPMF